MQMRTLLTRVAFSLLLLISLGFAATQDSKAGRFTGTFSSFKYNHEGGDVNGTELRILVGKFEYYGLLQIAEGAPGTPMLVPVTWIEKEPGKFKMSISQAPYKGEIIGQKKQDGIEITFKFINGISTKEYLIRKKSYWD